MKKVVKYCDLTTLKSVNFSYFQSKLAYCISSCGSTSKRNTKKKKQKSEKSNKNYDKGTCFNNM